MSHVDSKSIAPLMEPAQVHAQQIIFIEDRKRSSKEAPLRQCEIAPELLQQQSAQEPTQASLGKHLGQE